VGDHQQAAPVQQTGKVLQQRACGIHVEAFGRFVQQQDRRIAQQCTGQRQPPRLPGRHRRAVLAHPGLQAAVALGPFAQAHAAQHRPQGGVAGIGITQPQVLGHAAGKHRRVLRQPRQLPVPVGLGEITQIAATVGQPPLLRIPQPQQQARQRGLAAAAVSTDGDAFAWRQGQLQAGQHRPRAAWPLEMHVIPMHARSRRHHLWRLRIVHRRRLLDDRLQAIGGNAPGLQRLPGQAHAGPQLDQRHGEEHQTCGHFRCDAPLLGRVQGQRQHRHQAQPGHQAMQGRGRDQAPAPTTIPRGQLLGSYAYLQLPGRIGVQRGQVTRTFQPFECSGTQCGTMRGTVGLFVVMATHAQPRHPEGDQQRQHRQQHRSRRQDQCRRNDRDQRQSAQRHQRPDRTHQQAVHFTDVAEQARQKVAGARSPQSCGCQRQRAAEEPHAQVAGDAQRGVVADQLLEIARHDARHRQPAYTRGR